MIAGLFCMNSGSKHCSRLKKNYPHPQEAHSLMRETSLRELILIQDEHRHVC